MFKLMDVPSQYMEIRTKEQFIAMLDASPFNTIHITTHGHIIRKTEEFAGFWTPGGTVGLGDFSPTILHNVLVVSTACKAGTPKFAKPFCQNACPKYYIAPKKKPSFHDAIYFAHWFYHNIFILKLSAMEAVKKYRKGYKNPHNFAIW